MQANKIEYALSFVQIAVEALRPHILKPTSSNAKNTFQPMSITSIGASPNSAATTLKYPFLYLVPQCRNGHHQRATHQQTLITKKLEAVNKSS